MKRLFEVARIADNINGNQWAWTTGNHLFYGTIDEVTYYCDYLYEEAWENVPKGCSLGYSFISRIVEDEVGEGIYLHNVTILTK